MTLSDGGQRRTIRASPDTNARSQAKANDTHDETRKLRS